MIKLKVTALYRCRVMNCWRLFFPHPNTIGRNGCLAVQRSHRPTDIREIIESHGCTVELVEVFSCTTGMQQGSVLNAMISNMVITSSRYVVPCRFPGGQMADQTKVNVSSKW